MQFKAKGDIVIKVIFSFKRWKGVIPMSEKQAKRMRKEMAENKPEVKAAPRKIWPKLVAIAVIIAVAGLGAYATRDKLAALIPQPEAPVIETIADVAESEGITVDELLAKCGMTELGFTAETSAEELYSAFTIESYAKFEDKTPEEVKKDFAIEQLANDTLWQDAMMKVPMGIVAQQLGTTFEEYVEMNGFPEEITEDMPYEEALALWQEKLAAEAPETNE